MKGGGGGGAPPAGATAQVATRPAGVGDGGTSWRLKALRRAQAAAAEEGKDVREVRRAALYPYLFFPFSPWAARSHLTLPWGALFNTF